MVEEAVVEEACRAVRGCPKLGTLIVNHADVYTQRTDGWLPWLVAMGQLQALVTVVAPGAFTRWFPVQGFRFVEELTLTAADLVAESWVSAGRKPLGVLTLRMEPGEAAWLNGWRATTMARRVQFVLPTTDWPGCARNISRTMKRYFTGALPV